MADVVWSSGGSTDGNVAGNYNPARVPTGTDVCVFDSSASNIDCTFSGVLTCTGMRFDNANKYTGTVNGNGNAITFGTSGLDCTGGANATLTLGAGTWSCGGHWDEADIGAFTGTGSTILLTGNGYNFIHLFSHAINNLTVQAGAAYTSTTRWDVTHGTLIVNGTLTINTVLCFAYNDVTIGAGGTLAGNNALSMYWAAGGATAFDNSAGGIVSCGLSFALRQAVIYSVDVGDAGKCTGVVTFAGRSGAILELTTCEFGGAVTFNSDTGGQDLEIANDHNDPNLTFLGNVTLIETGTITYTKGAGKNRHTGGSDTTLTTLNKSLETTEIEKDAATDKVTLVDGLQCVDFTGIEGRFDPAGQTLTISGNCDWQDGFNFNDAADTLNGSDWQIGGNFTTIAIDLASNSSAGWDLDVTGTAVALGAGDVADCTAGVTEIDATDGPYTDSGGNTNWNFGVGAVAPTSHLYGSLVGCLGGPV